MTAIGSVFLGDIQQRVRLLSSTSPPTSPKSPSGFARSAHPAPPSMPSPTSSARMTKPDVGAPPPPHIGPQLSLELRLRWLEAILLGVRQNDKDRRGKAHPSTHGETLLRTAEDVQQRLDAIVQSNDGLRRFMDHYDQHAYLLTPTFALAGTLPVDPPSYENMSASELEAFLVEMEPDIRAAERDMREIEALEKKGVTSAGKLSDHEALQSRLDKLLKAHEEDLELAASLEKRIAGVMERHATQVDALSELFVAWDDTISDAETKVLKLDRDLEEKRRLGLE